MFKSQNPKLSGSARAVGLHAPRHDVRSRAFCGPTAIAAVTGQPISVIRDAIRHASGRIARTNGSAWPVMGVSNGDLIAAMRLLGWRVVEEWTEPPDGRPYTLDQFAKDRGAGGPFILNVTGHYIAIANNQFCDPFSGLPVDLGGGVLDRSWYGGRKRRGTWVRRWWRFVCE